MVPADLAAGNHLVAADIHRIAARFAAVHSRPVVRIPPVGPAGPPVDHYRDRLAVVVMAGECNRHTGLADLGLAPG